MPLISIVIPVYNGEDFIARCVSSCLAQSYRHIEVIVVDDGSTDRTGDILKGMSSHDPRLLVVSTPNCGVAVARSRGIERSRGEYLAFVDADDFLPPKSVECLIGEANGTFPDMILGKYIWIAINETVPDAAICSGHTVQKQPDFLRDVLVSGLIPVFAKLIRRDLFNNIIVPSGIKWGEDFVMMVQLSAFAKTVFVTQNEVYYYCENIKSVTKSCGYDVFVTWRLAKQSIEKFLVQHGVMNIVEREWRLREMLWELTSLRTSLRWGNTDNQLRQIVWRNLVRRPDMWHFVLNHLRWKWCVAFLFSLVSPQLTAHILKCYGHVRLNRSGAQQFLFVVVANLCKSNTDVGL